MADSLNVYRWWQNWVLLSTKFIKRKVEKEITSPGPRKQRASESNFLFAVRTPLICMRFAFQIETVAAIKRSKLEGSKISKDSSLQLRKYSGAFWLYYVSKCWTFSETVQEDDISRISIRRAIFFLDKASNSLLKFLNCSCEGHQHRQLVWLDHCPWYYIFDLLMLFLKLFGDKRLKKQSSSQILAPVV